MNATARRPPQRIISDKIIIPWLNPNRSSRCNLHFDCVLNGHDKRTHPLLCCGSLITQWNKCLAGTFIGKYVVYAKQNKWMYIVHGNYNCLSALLFSISQWFMGRNLLFNFCTIPRVNDISKSSTTVLILILIIIHVACDVIMILLSCSRCCCCCCWFLMCFTRLPHPRHNYIPFRNTFQSILYGVRTDGHKSLHLIILGAYNIFCVLGKWCFMNNIVHPEDSTICSGRRGLIKWFWIDLLPVPSCDTCAIS